MYVQDSPVQCRRDSVLTALEESEPCLQIDKTCVPRHHSTVKT